MNKHLIQDVIIKASNKDIDSVHVEDNVDNEDNRYNGYDDIDDDDNDDIDDDFDDDEYDYDHVNRSDLV